MSATSGIPIHNDLQQAFAAAQNGGQRFLKLAIRNGTPCHRTTAHHCLHSFCRTHRARFHHARPGRLLCRSRIIAGDTRRRDTLICPCQARRRALPVVGHNVCPRRSQSPRQGQCHAVNCPPQLLLLPPLTLSRCCTHPLALHSRNP